MLGLVTLSIFGLTMPIWAAVFYGAVALYGLHVLACLIWMLASPREKEAPWYLTPLFLLLGGKDE